MREPGFTDGVRSVFHGIAFLRRTRAAWPFAVVPVAVLAALFAVSVYLAVGVVSPGVAARLPEGTSALGAIGAVLVRIAAALAAMLAGLAVSLWLTPILSAPALDELVALRLVDLGATHLEPASFLRQMGCGLRAQALAVLVGMPLFGVLWMATLLAPPLAFVTLPLKLLVLAATVTWGLLDYPLSRRGIRLRERVRLLVAGKSAALGFGVVFAALFAVPIVGIALLPAGVVAATELVELLGASAVGARGEGARSG